MFDKIKRNKLYFLLLTLLITLVFTGCGIIEDTIQIESDINTEVEEFVQYGESYTSKDEVATYILEFEELPPNYITKKEARELGWEAEKGNLWEVTDGKSIGGDRFGNREGLLPEAEGRIYYECDIDYDGGFRGPKRLVYSNDGLIYYTEDHYKSFEKIGGN